MCCFRRLKDQSNISKSIPVTDYVSPGLMYSIFHHIQVAIQLTSAADAHCIPRYPTSYLNSYLGNSKERLLAKIMINTFNVKVGITGLLASQACLKCWHPQLPNVSVQYSSWQVQWIKLTFSWLLKLTLCTDITAAWDGYFITVWCCLHVDWMRILLL